MNCPICEKNNTEQIFKKLKNSVSSDSILIDKEISNVICKLCGHIFNEFGSRNQAIEFFTTDYKLHEETENAEFKFFSDGISKTHQDIRMSLLENNLELQSSGKILDIGCGKGNFLSAFSKKFPKWELYGIEISKSACEIAKKTISKLNIHQGHFTKEIFGDKKFDLIVSHGVIEHLETPNIFLKHASSKLENNGLFFFEVPNFKLNPSDLYTFDHLSHFTKETFQNLLNKNGIKAVQILDDEEKISLYSICKKSNDNSLIKNHYSFMKKISDEHIKFNESFMETYETVCKKFKNIGVFGLGLIGLAGIQNSKLKKNQIKFFFDENDLLIGTKKLGIEILGLNSLKNHKSLPIVLSASPCYLSAMSKKLEKIGVEFFVPKNYQYYKKYFL